MSDPIPSERSSDPEAAGDRPATLGPDAPAAQPAAPAAPAAQPAAPATQPAAKPEPPVRPVPPPTPPPVPLGDGASGDDSSPLSRLTTLVDERPEIAIGGAFGGGLVLALILKRLAH